MQIKKYIIGIITVIGSFILGVLLSGNRDRSIIRRAGEEIGGAREENRDLDAGLNDQTSIIDRLAERERETQATLSECREQARTSREIINEIRSKKRST